MLSFLHVEAALLASRKFLLLKYRTTVLAWYDKNVVPDRQVGLHARPVPVQDLLHLNLKREQPEIFNMAAHALSCCMSREVYFFQGVA
jgi:hypothetical protein